MRARLLGRIEVSNGKNVLNEENIHSKMTCKLLAYLLMNRNKVSTKDEIIEHLWPGEESDNPLGALKTLMSRTRNLLNTYLGKGSYIETKKGGYQWNSERELILDVDEFGKLYTDTKDFGVSNKVKMKKLEQAFTLYEGEFLNSIDDMHWIVVLKSYYHTLMIKIVARLSELYIACERYEDLEHICIKALAFDYADEDVHYYLILSQICLKKVKSALDAYHNAIHIIREELGITEPMRIKLLEGRIMKLSEGQQDKGTLNSIITELEERTKKGAFFCEYPIFKEIYHLESRRLRRIKQAGFNLGGNSTYLLLLNIERTMDNPSNYHMQRFFLNKLMEDLKQSIQHSLRVGDVFTQYSDRQYTILLDCQEENCKMIGERIIRNMGQLKTGTKIKVEYQEV